MTLRNVPRSRVLLVLVAALAVLAGCSGAMNGDSSAGAPQSGGSSADVADDGPSESDAAGDGDTNGEANS